jgi:hypothetical protein
MSPYPYLTLVAGSDLTEPDGAPRREGPLWYQALDVPTPGPLVILKPHVADWCFEHIGPYRLVEELPSGDWRIEFKDNGSEFAFRAMWGEK